MQKNWPILSTKRGASLASRKVIPLKWRTLDLKISSFIETFVTFTSLKHSFEIRGDEKSIFPFYVSLVCLLECVIDQDYISIACRFWHLLKFTKFKLISYNVCTSHRFKKRKKEKTHFGDVSHWVLCHVRLRAHAFPLKQRMKYKATLQSSLGKTHNCKIESEL